MAARRMKCDRCGKVKNDVMLCADDNLCRACEVDNERELTRIKRESAVSNPSTTQPPLSATAAGQSGCECGKPDNSMMLKCDICLTVSHPSCAGIPDPAVKHLQALLIHTGWVCANCRLQSRLLIKNLQSGQARLVEEVAELKAAICDLKEYVSNVTPQPTATTTVAEQSMRKIVQSELTNKERRAKNIVITGLAPSNTMTDENLFLTLCEENLPTKPLIVRDRCRRLGKLLKGKYNHSLLHWCRQMPPPMCFAVLVTYVSHQAQWFAQASSSMLI